VKKNKKTRPIGGVFTGRESSLQFETSGDNSTLSPTVTRTAFYPWVGRPRKPHRRTLPHRQHGNMFSSKTATTGKAVLRVRKGKTPSSAPEQSDQKNSRESQLTDAASRTEELAYPFLVKRVTPFPQRRARNTRTARTGTFLEWGAVQQWPWTLDKQKALSTPTEGKKKKTQKKVRIA